MKKIKYLFHSNTRRCPCNSKSTVIIWLFKKSFNQTSNWCNFVLNHGDNLELKIMYGLVFRDSFPPPQLGLKQTEEDEEWDYKKNSWWHWTIVSILCAVHLLLLRGLPWGHPLLQNQSCIHVGSWTICRCFHSCFCSC